MLKLLIMPACSLVLLTENLGITSCRVYLLLHQLYGSSKLIITRDQLNMHLIKSISTLLTIATTVIFTFWIKCLKEENAANQHDR